MAVAPRGSMYDPSAVFYMEKLVAGPEAADVVDIRLPVAENISLVAKAKGVQVSDVTVCVLDRPRHADLVDEIRATGARIKFIMDGDVAGAITAARPDTGVDMLVGVGGTPEGIITACAMKCVGGIIQGRLWPTDDDERQRAIDAGLELDVVLDTDDLVRTDDCFFVATGITDGELMDGVRYGAGRAVHRVHRHALAQRHGPQDHQRAPAAQAEGVLDRRLRDVSGSGEQFASLPSGIDLCYETFGNADDPPVLLIMGLGGPMNWWDVRRSAQRLADRGFFVIRYDNRDTGRSTKLRQHRVTKARHRPHRARPRPRAVHDRRPRRRRHRAARPPRPRAASTSSACRWAA